MTAGPEHRHRRSIRLREYDYAQPGSYFVTICVQSGACLFGEVVNGEMRLNELGDIVRACWQEIPAHFTNVQLDAFVVMPNHLHGIVWIMGPPDNAEAQQTVPAEVGARHAVPLQPSETQDIEQFGRPVPGSIPTIIRSFKSAVTKRIHDMRHPPGVPVWQRNYYEHIIRDERSLKRIRHYIVENPLRWHLDRENPDRNTALLRPTPGW